MKKTSKKFSHVAWVCSYHCCLSIRFNYSDYFYHTLQTIPLVLHEGIKLDLNPFGDLGDISHIAESKQDLKNDVSGSWLLWLFRL